jgi:hypothetical protein
MNTTLHTSLNLTIKKIALAGFALMLISACGGMQSRSADLLAMDYHGMTVANLHTYYQQLNDQLGMATYAARRSANYIWQSADDAKDLAALRRRWNEVRLELQRRQDQK